MQILFTVTLILNLLVEAMAAAFLIGGPEGIAAADGLQGGRWSMHYGFAVVAIASAVFWIWPYRSDLKAVTALLGVLLTFHSAVFVSLTIAGDQMAGMVMHAVLAVLCAFLFTQRSKWCHE